MVQKAENVVEDNADPLGLPPELSRTSLTVKLELFIEWDLCLRLGPLVVHSQRRPSFSDLTIASSRRMAELHCSRRFWRKREVPCALDA